MTNQLENTFISANKHLSIWVVYFLCDVIFGIFNIRYNQSRLFVNTLKLQQKTYNQ